VLHALTGAYASVGEAALQGVTAQPEINATRPLGASCRSCTPTRKATRWSRARRRARISPTTRSASSDQAALEIWAIQGSDADKIPFRVRGRDTPPSDHTDPMLWRDSPPDLHEGVGDVGVGVFEHGYKKARHS